MTNKQQLEKLGKIFDDVGYLRDNPEENVMVMLANKENAPVIQYRIKREGIWSQHFICYDNYRDIASEQARKKILDKHFLQFREPPAEKLRKFFPELMQQVNLKSQSVTSKENDNV